MDLEEASALAATGDVDAIYHLGQIHHLGEEVDQDIAKAIAYLEQADELGHPLASWALGVIYSNGEFIEKNDSKTFVYWSRSADLGYPPAALQAGLKLLGFLDDPSFHDDNREVSVLKLVNWWEFASEEGIDHAAHLLARFYHTGLHVPKDLTKANHYLNLAAIAGSSAAQSDLAIVYINGLGVEKDFVEARKWCELAAADDDKIAIRNLGLMYLNGDGVDVDLVFAFNYFKRGAFLGHADCHVE